MVNGFIFNCNECGSEKNVKGRKKHCAQIIKKIYQNAAEKNNNGTEKFTIGSSFAKLKGATDELTD